MSNVEQRLEEMLNVIEAQGSALDGKLTWLINRQLFSEATDKTILERLRKLETLVDGLVRA